MLASAFSKSGFYLCFQLLCHINLNQCWVYISLENTRTEESIAEFKFHYSASSQNGFQHTVKLIVFLIENFFISSIFALTRCHVQVFKKIVYVQEKYFNKRILSDISKHIISPMDVFTGLHQKSFLLFRVVYVFQIFLDKDTQNI